MSVALGAIALIAIWALVRVSRREAVLTARLKRSDELFVKSFQAYPESVMVTRLRDGKVVETNGGFESFAGYSRDQVIGQTTLTFRCE